MKIEPPSKIVGSPVWHIYYGLFLGWAFTAGAPESVRDWLFGIGLLMFFIMGVTELVYRRRAAKRQMPDSALPPNA